MIILQNIQYASHQLVAWRFENSVCFMYAYWPDIMINFLSN